MMRTRWIHREAGDKLLVFFSGWGVDCNPFMHLHAQEYDVLFVDHYFDLEFGDIPQIISEYDYSVVIGWSMGVYVADVLLKECNVRPDRLLAVNGSPFPIEEDMGIAPQWFEATLNNFDQGVLEKFYKRMCGSKDILADFMRNAPQRSLRSLKEELRFLYDQCKSPHTVIEKTAFDSALVATRDMVFTVKSQREAWQKVDCPYVEIKAPHFCFNQLIAWEDVVSLAQGLS